MASDFLLRVLVSRVIALFRNGRLEQKLDKELRSHLERQVEENMVKLDASRARSFSSLSAPTGLT